MAELVDNAIEAQATEVRIVLENDPVISGHADLPISIYVVDNGTGMSRATLQFALQFGGTSRFNSREGLGRYGMGLPNSSLSQAKRLDVFTWQTPNRVIHSHVDVDAISSGQQSTIPLPMRSRVPAHIRIIPSESGTVVCWTQCDRLSSCRVKVLEKHLHRHLGQMFRRFIKRGHRIFVNGKRVSSFDPLFVDDGDHLSGARQFGPELRYTIKFSKPDGRRGQSTVIVRFSELPVDQWHMFPNQEKRSQKIAKHSGVSVLRADREIDYGWHFMGRKRRENYDDWWRCEISFKPPLDELFGVSHTKQGIRPTDALKEILAPELEAIAHKLNTRVRERFARVKAQERGQRAARRAGVADPALPPPNGKRTTAAVHRSPLFRPLRISPIPGLKYVIKAEPLDSLCFYTPLFDRKQLTLLINSEHAFFQEMYKPLYDEPDVTNINHRARFELLLLSASRAETLLLKKHGAQYAEELRTLWGRVLETFLT